VCRTARRLRGLVHRREPGRHHGPLRHAGSTATPVSSASASEQTDLGTTTYTPHTFAVSKGGLSGNRVVSVDQNRLVTVTVTDNHCALGYIMNTEPPVQPKAPGNQVS